MCLLEGATPKRSLSVSSGAMDRFRRSTLKRVWACHPDEDCYQRHAQRDDDQKPSA